MLPVLKMLLGIARETVHKTPLMEKCSLWKSVTASEHWFITVRELYSKEGDTEGKKRECL